MLLKFKKSQQEEKAEDIEIYDNFDPLPNELHLSKNNSGGVKGFSVDHLEHSSVLN